MKCQKFGHSIKSCKNIAVYQICAENHLTRLHIYRICETNEIIYIHTKIKCSNCTEKHTANSKESSTFLAILAAKKLNSNSNSNSNSTDLNSNSESIKIDS